MPHTSGRRPVLLVDDDGGIAACAPAVRARGFEVDVVSPQTALHRILDDNHAVVVVDLAQPGRGGEPLIDELCVHCPAVLFVAVADPPAIARARSHRLDTAIAGFVPRPFGPDDLIAALRDASELRERRDRNRAMRFDRIALLLVEDSSGDAELVIDHLQDVCRASVTRCTRIDDAVRALHDRDYDFVISDLTLPDASGLDAVRRLQAIVPDVPLIVLTGVDDEDLALQALQDGAQDYLVKGQVDAATLRRSLRHARERKLVSNRLVYMTRHDLLTGAANRAALRERIETTLLRARRCALTFAVMFVDLDRFKAVNDTCGHDAGDAVLCEVAERLRGAVRTSDVVARLGGDEFAVFLDDLDPAWSPDEVAERIRRTIERPIEFAGRDLVVTASIGVARYPDVAGSVDDILKAADSAMYLAKAHGRNNVQIHGADVRYPAQLALASDLQHALERDELALHFQPQYTVDRDHVVGFEALLRWNRRGCTPVPPAEFIPLLEDSGRIIAVGEWVLDRACAQLATWREDGWTDLRIAVNLSPRQIAHDDLVDCVRRCLHRHAVPAPSLELEITETTLMADTRRATATLAELRALGVRLAIDDFGTGYSSLAYLSRFPVDCLKIDRSLIHEVDVDRDRGLIATTIVTLGHHLGLDVVAEGVETPEQLAFLGRAQCDLAQGYLLGRPAVAPAFARPAHARRQLA